MLSNKSCVVADTKEDRLFLLKESIKIGVYKRQDFKKNPQKYCGTKITDSPLDI